MMGGWQHDEDEKFIEHHSARVAVAESIRERPSSSNDDDDDG